MDEPSERLGYDHRKERHYYNEKDEKYIREYWDKKDGLGEKAVVEWLFHIALDNLSTAFKKSQHIYGDDTYNFFMFGLAKSGYIYLDFDRLYDDELKEEFSDDFFEDSYE